MLLKSFTKDLMEAGCDEAGRGCLAGPVYAAAVILPNDFHHPTLNDSKKLNLKQREILRKEIERDAISWAIGICTNDEIDEINILNASFLAMHRALSELKTQPEYILVDGNRFKPFAEIEHMCIVKGDSTYLSIAAASILAKTYRDDYMESLHTEFPLYGWNNNKGYPTKIHKQSIARFGITKYHRKSFRLNEQLKFPF
jgi:ribonuclease HII